VEASYGAQRDEHERFEEPEEGFESAQEQEDVLDVRHAEGARAACQRAVAARAWPPVARPLTPGAARAEEARALTAARQRSSAAASQAAMDKAVAGAQHDERERAERAAAAQFKVSDDQTAGEGGGADAQDAPGGDAHGPAKAPFGGGNGAEVRPLAPRPRLRPRLIGMETGACLYVLQDVLPTMLSAAMRTACAPLTARERHASVRSLACRQASPVCHMW
jgi:hypothetical protein